MPHYSIQEFNEPRFVQYESYYFTLPDESYGNGGPYGEPISYYQDDFFYEPSSPAYPELVDFTGRFWNEHGLTDQAYKEMQPHLPYSSGDFNWLGEYESYVDGQWKEDILSQKDITFDDITFDYEEHAYDHKQTDHKHAYNHMQTALSYSWNDVYDYDIDKQSAYDYKSWLGSDFVPGYSINEESVGVYEPFYGENEPSYSWDMYEMRLCDKIFGTWPTHSPTDNESHVEEAQA